ncbi:MAG: hypothetical protein EZS28_004909 [Streblomastix strix]|uniref:Integrase catalytic domain-containing protein n=1 Tax=Streblomastix strix TaxID=222440 RepID=A0A5J4WWY2_9EUKA|nr:MAG: hypothetical protein EZS28_004909 [Streblomastix strix]
MVDSVVKTIRNGFGTSSNDFADPEKLQQLVYIYNKTPHMAYDNKFPPEEIAFSYMKRRRQFNELAEFTEYRNVEVPIYYYKKVSENIDSLPQVYLQEFDIFGGNNVAINI